MSESSAGGARIGAQAFSPSMKNNKAILEG
jgi:hypothetical protein